jgi:pancreatic triacylglycerol lipase
MNFPFDFSHFEPGLNYTYVVVGNDIGFIKESTVIYTYKSSFMNPLSWRLVKPRIYVEYAIIESLEYHSK